MNRMSAIRDSSFVSASGASPSAMAQTMLQTPCRSTCCQVLTLSSNSGAMQGCHVDVQAQFTGDQFHPEEHL